MSDPIRAAVGDILRNVTNYPEPARLRLIGQDLSPLIDQVTEAVHAASPTAQWQYSYVEYIGRHGDVHERVTFSTFHEAQRYLDDNAELVEGWNAEVRKRDHKAARIEQREMLVGTWVQATPRPRTEGEQNHA